MDNNKSEKKIIAFGNPLLDTVIVLTQENDSILTKYKLQPNDQKEITQEEMNNLLQDTENYEKTVSAGGCGQNTLRVLKWLTQKKCYTCTIVGSVGDDEEGLQLKNILHNHSVETLYITQNCMQTGTTVALTNGNNRSLVAHLGAAEKCSLDDIKANSKILDELDKADLVYIEGFFLTKRLEAANFILNRCISNKKCLIFNLCGEYLCNQQPKEVTNFVKNCSIIFGNKFEFEALLSYVNQSLEQYIDFLVQEGKTVIMTDGAAPVLCKNSYFCQQIDVPKLKQEEIVDTTGAGDAFVAGFLSGYLLEMPMNKCVNIGIYAAQEIIKRRGCTVPKYDSNYLFQ